MFLVGFFFVVVVGGFAFIFFFKYRQAFQFTFKFLHPNLSFPKLQRTSKLKVEILNYPSAWESCQNMSLLRTGPFIPLGTLRVTVFPFFR